MNVTLYPNLINSYQSPKTQTFKADSRNFSQLGKIAFPDYKQLYLGEVSEYYCAPVSAGNALIGLAQKYPNLKQNMKPEKFFLLLGNLFKTTNNGTTNNNLCNGLDLFIKQSGYTPSIEYYGIKTVDSKFKKGSIPDINWIKNSIEDGNAVLINLGVYKKNGTNFNREYGHFVLATGKNFDGHSPNPDYININDPYDKFGGTNYIKLSKLDASQLLDSPQNDEKLLTKDAKNLNQVVTPLSYYTNKNETAIIEGAIKISLK